MTENQKNVLQQLINNCELCTPEIRAKLIPVFGMNFSNHLGNIRSPTERDQVFVNTYIKTQEDFLILYQALASTYTKKELATILQPHITVRSVDSRTDTPPRLPYQITKEQENLLVSLVGNLDSSMVNGKLYSVYDRDTMTRILHETSPLARELILIGATTTQTHYNALYEAYNCPYGGNSAVASTLGKLLQRSDTSFVSNIENVPPSSLGINPSQIQPPPPPPSYFNEPPPSYEEAVAVEPVVDDTTVVNRLLFEQIRSIHIDDSYKVAPSTNEDKQYLRSMLCRIIETFIPHWGVLFPRLAEALELSTCTQRRIQSINCVDTQIHMMLTDLQSFSRWHTKKFFSILRLFHFTPPL